MSLHTIGARIALAVGSALLGLLLVLLTGVAGLNQLQDHLTTLIREDTVKSDLSAQMRLIIVSRVNAVRNIALMTEIDAMQADLKTLDELASAYAGAREQLLALPLSSAEQAALKQADEAEKLAAPLIKTALALARTMNGEMAAQTLTGKFAPVQAQWLQGLKTLSDSAEADRSALLARTQADSRRMLWLMAAVGLLAFCGAGALSLFLARGMTRRLSRAVAITRDIAQGDLSQQLPQGRSGARDEVGQTLGALAEMQQRLQGTIGGVRESALAIDTACGEIAAGSNDLSARTEQSASSLQETASALEQLTGTVRSSADNAAMATRLADSASGDAQRGGSVVREVVSTMQDINASSRRISEIIGVIDGIAFQTNILALNAAVEAARAGEQGRGFAVVASEVRNLAQRSAQAAREIKTLINTSVERVDAGSRLVDEAGTAMTDIVASVRRVSEVIAEIATAASEQNDGINQINTAVAQLDEMTQQNAALVEQSAAAASSLREQSQRLAQAVSEFRLASA